MKKTEEQKKKNSIMDVSKLGITQEEIEKAEEIKESFDFTNLALNDVVTFEFISNDVNEVLTTAKNSNEKKKIKKGDKVLTPCINVKVISLQNKDGLHVLDDENKIYNLWLSSKTLALGIGKISLYNKDRENGLIGLRFEVKKSKASFKEGENTCYIVNQTTF